MKRRVCRGYCLRYSMKKRFKNLSQRIASLEYEQKQKEAKELERRARIEQKLAAIRDNSVKIFSLSTERE
jgi:hypothetical protein